MEDCNTVLTPMEVGQHLTSEGCPDVPDKSVVKHCQQLVGALNYLMVWSMPELEFPVCNARDHVAAAKRILLYAEGAKGLGTTYTCNTTKPNQLYAYVDADHAGDPAGEFYAASAVGCELVFLRSVADAMGFRQSGPTPVAEDNIACIYMSKSSAMYHKAKAIDTRVYRLREFVQDGVMELYYVATSDQVADCFTKSLPSDAVRRHRTTISGSEVQASERG
eukprot:195263-Rhodomonas_salina.1